MSLRDGPQPQTRAQRLEQAETCCTALQARYGADLLGVALYGSTARGDDTPYSDLELFAVLEGDGLEQSFEWIQDRNKIEINLYTPDTLWARALEIDLEWSVARGEFVYTHPLFEARAGFFAELRRKVLEPDPQAVEAALVDGIVCELYERLGKARSAAWEGNTASLTERACWIAWTVAWLLGLATRQPYTTSSRTLEQSLKLEPLPVGYRELVVLVQSGDLRDPAAVLNSIEILWTGVLDWAEALGLPLSEPDLRSRNPF